MSFLLELLVIRVVYLSCPQLGRPVNFFLDDRSRVYGQAPERRVQLALQDFSGRRNEAYVGHSVGVYSWGQSSQHVLQTDGGLLERSLSPYCFLFQPFYKDLENGKKELYLKYKRRLEDIKVGKIPDSQS